MQTIEICEAEFVMHCPCCGQRAFSKKGEVQPCKHLMYVSCSETPVEPWYTDKSVDGSGDADYAGTLVALLRRKFRSPAFLLFLLSEPAPAALELYVVYCPGA